MRNTWASYRDVRLRRNEPVSRVGGVGGGLKPAVIEDLLGRLSVRLGSLPAPSLRESCRSEPSPPFCCLDVLTGLTYTKGKESSLKSVFLLPWSQSLSLPVVRRGPSVAESWGGETRRASLELAIAREQWGAPGGCAGRHLWDHRPGATFEFAREPRSLACALRRRSWEGGGGPLPAAPGAGPCGCLAVHDPAGWSSGTAQPPPRGALGGPGPGPASPAGS